MNKQKRNDEGILISEIETEEIINNEQTQIDNSDANSSVNISSHDDKRKKIDKLLNKKDIRYNAPLTYRSVRVVGFVLMFLAQIALAYSLAGNIITLSEQATDTILVLQILSAFALPMFLVANFCIIMSSKEKIKKYLISYSIIAIAIYILVLFFYYRYIYGATSIIFGDDQALAESVARLIANKLFGETMNYNVFVDLALFSMFFFFLFYNPKKQMSKKKMMVFRLCSIIPVVFAVSAFVLYALYYFGRLDLPMYVVAILPCRSLTVYIILFAITLVMKIRKSIFIKWGGTSEEYKQYLTTRRNNLEVSILSSLIVIIICSLDFVIMCIDPIIWTFGVGTSWHMIAVVPFLFFLSYSKKPKHQKYDFVLPIGFIVACIILYLELILFVIRNSGIAG